MYQIREVVLHRGSHEKKRLVIEFMEREQAILGEFLMVDAPMLAGEILQELEAVMSDKQKSVVGSGNRCSWNIDACEAVIDDLFADIGDDIPSMPTCTIETKKLYELIDMWLTKLREFENK